MIAYVSGDRESLHEKTWAVIDEGRQEEWTCPCRFMIGVAGLRSHASPYGLAAIEQMERNAMGYRRRVALVALYHGCKRLRRHQQDDWATRNVAGEG
jgi:hypothetical protein